MPTVFSRINIKIKFKKKSKTAKAVRKISSIYLSLPLGAYSYEHREILSVFF